MDWLGLHKKRTCPECRAVVSTEPAPAFLIRDMIETFVLRAELNSPHGAGAELRKQQKDALAVVKRDRASEGTPHGGIFQGMFKHSKPVRALRDSEDGVVRCPVCLWEVSERGGMCTGCNRRVLSDTHLGHDFSDDDDDDDDDDQDDDDDDDDDDNDDDEERGDDSGSETDSQEGLAWADGEVDLGAWEGRGLAERIRRLNRRRYVAGFSDEEDEDGYVDGMRGVDGRGRRTEPIVLDEDSDLSLEIAYTNRARAERPRIGQRPPVGVISQARDQRGRRGAQQSSEVEEEEEEDSEDEDEDEDEEEDEDEGSLQDFVVHDTPENRRRPTVNRNVGNNRNGSVAVGGNQGFQPPYGPMIISSSPAIPVPTRRNPRSRRIVTDTDEDESLTISETPPPPPFLGEIHHDYDRRRGPIALPSDNDDEEEELLGPGMGYTPLEHTASENEDDGFSSPPRRERRRGQAGRDGPSSVFSVPEEDEDDGDNDDSEDGDGDIRMAGGAPRPRRRPLVPNDDDDEDSDSDNGVVPVGRRRRGLPNAHSYFRTHHHAGTGRRQREIVPNLLDAFQQHRQAMSERQLDNLGFMNSARSTTPVQRHYTGGSSRGRSTREGTAESGWGSVQGVTPMRQSSPPPPFSPMFQGVSSSPPPMQPNSPGSFPQSPASPRLGAGVRATSESSSIWSPLASPQLQQRLPPPQQHRQVPITIGSSPQATRIRSRNSRQQLRGSSSRAGLRVGSITPTPTTPSPGSLASRASSATPSLTAAATRGRRGLALTAEDIRARGEAVRRRQQEAAEAARGLGRRSSRRDLAATGGASNAPVAGRVVNGAQGRRLGAVIGGPTGGGGGGGGTVTGGMGGGPMLVIGSEDD